MLLHLPDELDAEPISNWRAAEVNEEVGTSTSSFDGSGKFAESWP